MQESSKEFVKYNSFDELPKELKEKFKNRAKGQLLDKAKDGYVDFISQLNQRGDELVGQYTCAMTKTQVRLGKCGHIVDINSNSYKRGRSCGVCSGKQVQRGMNDLATFYPHLLEEWHPIKNGELTPHDVTQGSGKKVWWKCDKNHEWEARIYTRVRGSNCPYCSNQKVLKGYNDLAKTHSQYTKYFVNIEVTYTHTYSSDKKVELKCPNCGHVKFMKISKLTYHGFSCDLCSDGISYPEKLVTSVLNRLGIEFAKQLSFDKGGHRYDFYLPKYNTIIETHGLQHYEQGFRGINGKTLKEEQKNDRYKRELALKNGVLEEDYYEVDCRYSTLEWCRPNIEKVLSNYVDMSALTDEDWKEADIQAQKSLKIEVCKYWRDNKEINSQLTVVQVAKVFGINNGTAGRYLKWGNTSGICSYDNKDQAKAHHDRLSKFVYLIKPDGSKWFEETMSIIGIKRATGISQSTVFKNLNKGALQYHHNSKYDPKYIGSRIVSAEVYDSQSHSS